MLWFYSLSVFPVVFAALCDPISACVVCIAFVVPDSTSLRCVFCLACIFLSIVSFSVFVFFNLCMRHTRLIRVFIFIHGCWTVCFVLLRCDAVYACWFVFMYVCLCFVTLNVVHVWFAPIPYVISKYCNSSFRVIAQYSGVSYILLHIVLLS